MTTTQSHPFAPEDSSYIGRERMVNNHLEKRLEQLIMRKALFDVRFHLSPERDEREQNKSLTAKTFSKSYEVCEKK